jgi:hypothetical protein
MTIDIRKQVDKSMNELKIVLESLVESCDAMFELRNSIDSRTEEDIIGTYLDPDSDEYWDDEAEQLFGNLSEIENTLEPLGYMIEDLRKELRSLYNPYEN